MMLHITLFTWTGQLKRSYAYSLSVFIKGTSNCGNNNGGCEQLCFHKVSNSNSCGCQLGMKLKNDGKSCEEAFKDGKSILSKIF